MIPFAEISHLRVFETLPEDALEVLSKDFEELTFEIGDYILHQHDEARAIFILLSGSVEFFMSLEGMKDLFVGTTSEQGALIGWSVIRQPYRYTASVRCSEPCRVLRLPRAALTRVLTDDPRAGCQILRAIAAALVDRLEDARGLLGRLPKTGPRLES